MLETMMKQGVMLYGMGVLAAAGALAKIISYITSRRLVRAAGDIQKSSQRLMRLVKAKFEHASMVSDKVQNVEAFVKKYLYEYRVFGVRLNTWRTFPVKMLWLIVTLGLLGIAVGYRMDGAQEQMFRCGVFAAAYATALMSLHSLCDEKTKLEAAKNYMVEYLENVCAHRYEKASQAARTPQAKEAAGQEAERQEAAGWEAEGQEAAEQKEAGQDAQDEMMEEPSANAEDDEEDDGIVIQLTQDEQEAKRKAEQEMRFRAILEEFLA